MDSNHDDFAASIGAVPADADTSHDDFAASIGATPADTTSAPSQETDSGHIWGLDTGTRVSHKDIQDLATKHHTTPELLEAQASRYGATYPDATAGEKAVTALYHGGDTLLGNIPSWIAKKFHDGNTEEAIDELKDTIQKNKSGTAKVADFATGMATPIGLPDAAATALAQTGKYAPTVATGTLLGGTYGLGNSKKGEELRDTVDSAEVGGTVAPLVHGALETAATGVAKTFGASKDMIRKYLTSPEYANKVIKDPANNFENVQSAIDTPRQAQIGQETDAAAAVADAKDTAANAQNMANQARSAYRTQVGNADVPASVPGRVDTALTKQRSVTRDLAQQQMDMLAGVPGKFSLASVDNGLADSLGKSSVDGQMLAGDKDSAAIAALRSMLDPLRPEPTPGLDNSGLRKPDRLDPEASAQSLVRLRQIADDKLHDVYTSPTGAHTDRAERAALGFRKGVNDILDTQLPNSQEYQGVRASLADESDLANRGTKTFGGDRSAQFSKLRGLADPKNSDDLATLASLDRAHDGQIASDMTPYLDAKNLQSKPDLLARSEAWLPEVEAAQHANEAVGTAKDTLQGLKDTHDPFAGITPENSQEKIRQMLFANDNKPQARTREQLEALGENSGQDLLGKIADLKMKNTFSAGGPNGSRLVNLGRSIGGLAGKPGEAVGGALGAGADYSTGFVAKTALDAYLKAKDPAVRAAAEAAAPIVDKLTQRLDANPAAKTKYATTLDNAAQRGPQAILAMHAALLKNQDYKDLMMGGVP